MTATDSAIISKEFFKFPLITIGSYETHFALLSSNTKLHLIVRRPSLFKYKNNNLETLKLIHSIRKQN